MSSPHNDSRPKPIWKRTWIILSAIVVTGAPLLDFATGAIGIVEKVAEWCSPPAPALVRISTEPVPDGPTCLRFSFERLPSEFTLGKIRFNVLAASGFRSGAHIAATPVYRQDRDLRVPTNVLNGRVKAIEHPVDVQSERENDAAIVTVCPVPADPGTSASLTLVPSFVSVAGTPIEDIEASTDDGSPVDKGFDVAVAPRPLTQGPALRSE